MNTQEYKDLGEKQSKNRSTVHGESLCSAQAEQGKGADIRLQRRRTGNFKKKNQKTDPYLINKGQYPNLLNLLSEKNNKKQQQLRSKTRRMQIHGKDIQDGKDGLLLVLVLSCALLVSFCVQFQNILQHPEIESQLTRHAYLFFCVSPSPCMTYKRPSQAAKQ